MDGQFTCCEPNYVKNTYDFFFLLLLNQACIYVIDAIFVNTGKMEQMYIGMLLQMKRIITKQINKNCQIRFVEIQSKPLIKGAILETFCKVLMKYTSLRTGWWKKKTPLNTCTSVFKFSNFLILSLMDSLIRPYSFNILQLKVVSLRSSVLYSREQFKLWGSICVFVLVIVGVYTCLHRDVQWISGQTIQESLGINKKDRY